MYGDLASSPYSKRYFTWLKTVLIRVWGSYCIAFVSCSRPTNWLWDILPYVMIRYWISMIKDWIRMKRVLEIGQLSYFAWK